MLLEPVLVETCVMKRAEDRGQASQCPDELKLCSDDIDNVAEAEMTGEVEPGLGLALHVPEGIAGGKEVRHEIVAAVSGKGEIADFVGRIEGAPDHRSARPDM